MISSIKIYFKSVKPGITLLITIILIAKILSIYIPIGTISGSILIGILVNQLFSLDYNKYKSGINVSEKYFLPISIALMGFSINSNILNSINYKTLYSITILILFTIIISIIIGKIFNLPSKLSILIGVGNAICGSSAIAAISPIVKADKDDIGISIAIINILGAIAIFILPVYLNLFFNGTIESKGLIIGSTIQAVGQVTAAGFMIGNQTGEIATLTKMIRILMLGPTLIIITVIYLTSNKKISLFPIPLFIIGFTLFFFISSLNVISTNVIVALQLISKFFLLLAMAAIGFSISFKSIYKKGLKVFFVASASFTIQIILSVYLTKVI